MPIHHDTATAAPRKKREEKKSRRLLPEAQDTPNTKAEHKETVNRRGITREIQKNLSAIRSLIIDLLIRVKKDPITLAPKRQVESHE
ncbi:hypothetical protein MMC28_005655, partial [Mycoblastus sanguinarius]|nr:hypothetical protein [Mycoblastus sanguinarius]